LIFLNAHESFQDDRTHHHLVSFFSYNIADDSNPDARTFEDLCRAHIQKFAKGAEKYASETQLSVRVGQWQDKLGPLLEEEEERPEFDIHAYGQTVIDSMEQEIRRLNPKTLELQDAPVKVVDFRRITRHCQQYEVCRMFLASLSLSNSGNVEIDTAGATDCKSLQLELVQSDIERPMETYLAPSAAVEGIHSLVA
jgi:condensin-2 complex subunit H2